MSLYDPSIVRNIFAEREIILAQYIRDCVDAQGVFNKTFEFIQMQGMPWVSYLAIDDIIVHRFEVKVEGTAITHIMEPCNEIREISPCR